MVMTDDIPLTSHDTHSPLSLYNSVMSANLMLMTLPLRLS